MALNLKDKYYELLSGAKTGLSNALSKTTIDDKIISGLGTVKKGVSNFVQNERNAAQQRSNINKQVLSGFGKGFVNTSTYGLVQPKIVTSTPASKYGNVVGSVAGIVNPLNPLNKAMSALNLGGRAVSAVAPRLATTTAGKIIGGLGSEALQTGAYTGAQFLAQKAGLRPNEPITPKTVGQNLLLGSVFRGALSPQFASKVKGMFGNEGLYQSDIKNVEQILEGLRLDRKSGRLNNTFRYEASKDAEVYRKAFNLMDKKSWSKLPLEDQYKLISNKLLDLKASGQPIQMGIVDKNQSTKGVGGEGVKLSPKAQKFADEIYDTGRTVTINGEQLKEFGHNGNSVDFAKSKSELINRLDLERTAYIHNKLRQGNMVKPEKMKTFQQLAKEFPELDRADMTPVVIQRRAREITGAELVELYPKKVDGFVEVRYNGKMGRSTSLNGALEDLNAKIINDREGIVPKTPQELAQLEREKTIGGFSGYDAVVNPNLSPSKGVGTNVNQDFLDSPADFKATRTPGSNSNVPEIDDPLLSQGKQVQKELPPESKEKTLPWEEPGYQSSTSLDSIQQSRQSPKSTPQGRVNPKSTSKLDLSSLKAPSNGSIPPGARDEIKKVENSLDRKVNALDWFRTPDRVLKKIGLNKEADILRSQYNKYLDELPKEIGRVTSWYERVRNIPNASQNIFKYLDGQKIQLNGEELKVAREMKVYLKEWADKLDLPADGRIASYITHIFEKDFIKKEFDEDLAKIIAERIPGSVYDPFLQKRLGQQGYVEDVFRALDAYVKRATRKYNMDPALALLQKKSEALPLESFKYVKSYADKINMRPSDIDNYLDSMVKQSLIGYKLGQRPTAAITKKLRQAVYRGTLGLNFGSALRNLTQGANTYAKLGEKYTLKGYIDVIKEIATNGDELKAVGVLRDDMIQDRQLSAVKGALEKADQGLFFFFNLAEKINRGSAYFGAKAKYLKEGLPEGTAIKKAVDLVRDTQFTFGSVDTPVAMQSDVVKLFTQFQSFNMKQTEFLAEMAKNKEFTGLVRWLGANLLMVASAGSLIGMDWKDIVPFSGFITGENKIGETPPIKLISDITKAGLNAPDKYGNVSDDNVAVRIAGAVGQNLPAFIPGGVQAKKTIQGVKAVSDEGSFSKSGRLQYPIEKTTGNYIRSGLFGKSNLPEAKEYFNSKRSVLGEKQTQEFKNASNKIEFYNNVLAEREQNARVENAREQVRQSGEVAKVGDIYLYKTQQFDSETGKMEDVVRSVDLGKQIPKIELSDKTELDKKLISSYNSAITSKISDITKLYKLNQISAEEAEKQIQELQKLKITKGKKPKKVSLKVPKMPKVKVVKLKTPKIKVKRVKSKKSTKVKVKTLKVKKFKPLKLKAKISKKFV